MVIDYPAIQKDELFFFYALRYHNFTGNLSVYSSLGELLGITEQVTNVQFINCASMYYRKIGISENDYIEQHSVLPFYRLFFSPERYSEFQDLFLNKESKKYLLSIKRLFGNHYSGRYLWYCPVCHRQHKDYSDLRKYHQVPGVYVCSEHRCYLNKVSVMRQCDFADPRRWDADVQACEDSWLYDLAEDIEFIFRKKPKLCLGDIRSGIQMKINQFMQEYPGKQFYKEIKKRFKHLPTEYQFGYSSFDLFSMLRFKPIEYLLFIRLLYGSFADFLLEREESMERNIAA